MREHWQDPEFRARGLKALRTPEKRAKNAMAQRKNWQDPNYRERAIVAQRAANTPEAAERRSASMKEVWSRPEFRVRGEEHLRKIARDPVRLAKISTSSKGRRYGPRTLEAIANMRAAAQKRAPASPQTNAKIADAMKEVWQDTEQAERRSASMKERWADPEYRAKVLLARGQGPVCRKGHHFDDANTRIDGRGHRVCKTCHEIASKASRARRKARE
jgi:hypothetical protein